MTANKSLMMLIVICVTILCLPDGEGSALRTPDSSGKHSACGTLAYEVKRYRRNMAAGFRRRFVAKADPHCAPSSSMKRIRYCFISPKPITAECLCHPGLPQIPRRVMSVKAVIAATANGFPTLYFPDTRYHLTHYCLLPQIFPWRAITCTGVDAIRYNA